ncbi:MAG: co-chaperone GroES [bacterium]|nr:co-chaperone GroES [bacterium]
MAKGTNSKIKPLGDRVLVEPVEVDEKSPFGIIIPDTASKEKPKQGVVIAVGELEEVKDVKVGDTVLFSDYGFDEVKIKDKEYYIIQSKNLLAKL